MTHDKLEIKVLVEDDSFIPVYTTAGAAGADVKACIQEDVTIPPGESRLIPTGIRVELPIGYEMQIRPRSGLALKHQLTVLNTPGTIDADYRGEVGVILINHGKNPFVVTRGMRIAQCVIAKVEQGCFIKEENLQATMRGEGGFGHSGTH